MIFYPHRYFWYNVIPQLLDRARFGALVDFYET